MGHPLFCCLLKPDSGNFAAYILIEIQNESISDIVYMLYIIINSFKNLCRCKYGMGSKSDVFSE